MNTLTRTRRMRTNAGPIILTSKRSATNVILDLAREIKSSNSMSEWAEELLWASQIFRLAYDSPRIGGGIDPAVASGVPTLDWGREDSFLVGYIIGSQDQPYGDVFDREGMGALDGYSADAIQDMIVHAEAVALLTLAVYGPSE